MTREELCKSVYKRAFYHAHHNFFNDTNSSKTTTIRVKYSRVFFYDAAQPQFYFHGEANDYHMPIIVNFNSVGKNLADIGRELVCRIHEPEHKKAYVKFIEDFNENDMFVDHDLYVESYFFIKRHLRNLYDDYVEHVINELWFNFVKSRNFSHEISCMLLAMNQPVGHLWPEHYQELLGLVLDNTNARYCLDKNFNECRSDVIHILTDSGVLETASE